MSVVVAGEIWDFKGSGLTLMVSEWWVRWWSNPYGIKARHRGCWRWVSGQTRFAGHASQREGREGGATGSSSETLEKCLIRIPEATTTTETTAEGSEWQSCFFCSNLTIGPG